LPPPSGAGHEGANFLNMKHGRIGIEFISVLGLPPVEFVELAADLGCRCIGIGLEPIARSKSYPPWSLREDAALRRDLLNALRRCGVSVRLGEGFLIWPDKDIRGAGADLDLMCELGVEQVNILGLDADRARTFDQCAVFAELADDRGLGATLEFMPGLCIGDFETAVSAVRHAGKGNFRVLVDAMHFFRSGSTLLQLAAADPQLIGHVQICDAPLQSAASSYADEARFGRLPPGEGELPLLELLAALPAQASIGIEVPMLARAEGGIGPHARLAPCLKSTLELLRQADALRQH
jgi:sugar phosphate isomerase/epimerase